MKPSSTPLTVLSALVFFALVSAGAERPNILLLYVDNVGYGDLGCYGNAVVKTPRIDRLASEGVRCTDFYVAASSCTPSRGAILTGRHPLRNGLAHQLATTENWTGIGLPHRERILPHYLKEAGYATACFGKWNIGFAPGSRPTERGFDEFFGFRSGNINYYTHTYHGEYDMFRGTERHKVEGYSTDLFADAARDFIRRKSGGPWFVYLPFNAAHYVSSINMAPGEKPEWQVPGKYLERYGWSSNDPDEKRRYLAVLTALDDAIGRVLDSVDELKLRDRTLVILISDNGAFMLPGCGLGVASNAPLRDGGTTAYEGGMRVPAMFRWPGKIRPAAVCREMLSHLDVLPLCLAAAGLPLLQNRVLDGCDPLSALTGRAKSPHRRLAFSYSHGNGSGLREGSLKLVRPSAKKPWELYDLATDLGESKNLAAERPADVTRLSAAFEDWLADVKLDASEPAPRPSVKILAANRPAASWSAVNEPVEIPADKAPRLGTGDFSIAVWARADATNRVTGDLLSRYDARKRRGFHLTLKCNPGATASQANWRHLQFGIDDDKPGVWRDCGRPGKAVFAFAMAAHEGALYAGTCEPGRDDAGHVYRYEGGERWMDCGSPDKANSVTALAAHEGALFAGTGRYRVAGSHLPESENTKPGGRVFRHEGGMRWVDCGQLPGTEAVGCLVVYQGRLYASSLYKPAGFFRYEGGTQWTRLPDAIGPDYKTGEMGPRRVVSLTVHDGFLYASSYDGGRVYRFDGKGWTDCGQVGGPDNTQTYAFASYEGRLHVATWRSGRVFRFEDVGRWTDIGRLGGELEVMGMMVHNGRFIGGTLPLAQVYAYDGEGKWSLWQRLDLTPNVEYRRAWTMAEHGGEVFCSTLPSGKVWAARHGRQVSWDHTLPAGWHHIAAVKTATRLTLHVDGRQVAESTGFDASTWNLDTAAPLRLGTGMNGPFNGQLADLQIYQRAPTATEITALASRRHGK